MLREIFIKPEDLDSNGLLSLNMTISLSWFALFNYFLPILQNHNQSILEKWIFCQIYPPLSSSIHWRHNILFLHLSSCVVPGYIIIKKIASFLIHWPWLKILFKNFESALWNTECNSSMNEIHHPRNSRILKIHYRIMHSYGFKSFTNSHIFTQYNGCSECNCLLSYISICFKFWRTNNNIHTLMKKNC